MLRSMSSHTRAVLQALFVTFLWSTSWVLIKLGLDNIPALTFAGLRYVLAWLCLLPFAWRGGHLRGTRNLTRTDWLQLTLLGVLFYAVTQGAQFIGLDRLPATTASLLLSLTPALVALLGVALLREGLTRGQWGGIALYLFGAMVYFYPVKLASGEVLGAVIVGAGALTNALSTLLGRRVNGTATISPVLVTVISMGIGSALLLAGGIAVQGLPQLDVRGIAIVTWLAVVNTAFAFTLWNHTQRTLPAVETSIINNTMLIQIALLAWLFLGEALNLREIVGLTLAALGTLIVQLWRVKTA